MRSECRVFGSNLETLLKRHLLVDAPEDRIRQVLASPSQFRVHKSHFSTDHDECMLHGKPSIKAAARPLNKSLALARQQEFQQQALARQQELQQLAEAQTGSNDGLQAVASRPPRTAAAHPAQAGHRA